MSIRNPNIMDKPTTIRLISDFVEARYAYTKSPIYNKVLPKTSHNQIARAKWCIPHDEAYENLSKHLADLELSLQSNPYFKAMEIYPTFQILKTIGKRRFENGVEEHFLRHVGVETYEHVDAVLLVGFIKNKPTRCEENDTTTLCYAFASENCMNARAIDQSDMAKIKFSTLPYYLELHAKTFYEFAYGTTDIETVQKSGSPKTTYGFGNLQNPKDMEFFTTRNLENARVQFLMTQFSVASSDMDPRSTMNREWFKETNCVQLTAMNPKLT